MFLLTSNRSVICSKHSTILLKRYNRIRVKGEKGVKTNSWVQTCKHFFSRTIVHETRYD